MYDDLAGLSHGVTTRFASHLGAVNRRGAGPSGGIVKISPRRLAFAPWPGSGLGLTTRRPLRG